MKNVTCNNCGWVHMGLTLKHIQREEQDFGNSGVRGYMNCFNCLGSYLNFRDYKHGDCPDGCTIQAILEFNERFGLNESEQDH